MDFAKEVKARLRAEVAKLAAEKGTTPERMIGKAAATLQVFRQAARGTALQVRSDSKSDG